MIDHTLELWQVNETVWITVNNISVRVQMTSEGAICDMYRLDEEDLDEAHLAACYAFFSEAREDKDSSSPKESGEE